MASMRRHQKLLSCWAQPAAAISKMVPSLHKEQSWWFFCNKYLRKGKNHCTAAEERRQNMWEQQLCRC